MVMSFPFHRYVYVQNFKNMTSVDLQVFNEFNARKPDQCNIFEGVLKNRLFMGIVGITIVLQVRTITIRASILALIPLQTW